MAIPAIQSLATRIEKVSPSRLSWGFGTPIIAEGLKASANRLLFVKEIFSALI